MTKLETLIACLPDAPFRTQLTAEIESLRKEFFLNGVEAFYKAAFNAGLEAAAAKCDEFAIEDAQYISKSIRALEKAK